MDTPQHPVSGHDATGLMAPDSAHHEGGPSAGTPPKSASIIKRAGAEFLAAVGLVSMFAAIGNALLPSIAAGSFTASALTLGGTAVGALPLLAAGLAVGITAMLGASALRKSIENDNKQAAKIEQERTPAKEKPTQVIVNNLQLQPNTDIEAEANFFTKMIEAERSASPQSKQR